MNPEAKKQAFHSSAPAALSDSTPAPAAKSTQRLGRFRVVSKLGKGGMGTVYRALDEQLNRYVALKVIGKDTSGKPTLRTEAFLREARSVAQLDHPNIVQLFEIGETPRYSFIAMELLEGGDLWQLFRAAGPIGYSRAALIASEAAEALHYAHGCGIVHRDIKPANLMLARNGRCKITDFGLARYDNPNDLFEFPTELVGTPFYIAPELIQGQPATAAVDVYSLAVTLWIVLVGSSPFSGKSRKELYESKLHDPLPDLRQLRPDLPVKLIDAIERGLERDPAQRVGMEQFGRMLRIHVHADAAAVAPSQWALAPSASAPSVSAPSAARRSSASLPQSAGALSWSLDAVGHASDGDALAVGTPLAKLGSAISRISQKTVRVIDRARSRDNRGPVLLGVTASLVLLASLVSYTTLHASEPVTQLPPLRASAAVSSRPIDAGNLLEVTKPLRWQSTVPIAVKGVVSDVELSGDYVIRFRNSDFIAKFSRGFARDMQTAFGGEGGSHLIGRTITVTGPVSGSRATPMIEVTEVAQIIVAQAEPPASKARPPLTPQ